MITKVDTLVAPKGVFTADLVLAMRHAHDGVCVWGDVLPVKVREGVAERFLRGDCVVVQRVDSGWKLFRGPNLEDIP